MSLQSRILNIYRLYNCCIFSPFFSIIPFQSKSPSFKSTCILCSISAAIIGCSKLGAAGRVIDLRSSNPAVAGPSHFYTMFSKLGSGNRELTLTNIWGSALSGKTADGGFNHRGVFLFLLLAGRRGTQLSTPVCVAACVRLRATFPCVCESARICA